ncbi:MAG: hypothetical protein BMS9Abin37_0618 [Acidobacteriota bacterium]|nr:MAG: hypothetical protein BMS9Abin37_0618 [Acidobacteriota bacterium]
MRTHPLCIFVRGLVAGLRGLVERILEHLRRAHELQPGDANVLGELCRFSTAAGLRNHGALVDKFVRIDPLTPVTFLAVSLYHCLNGRHQEAALAQVTPAMGRGRTDVFTWTLAGGYALIGRNADAVDGLVSASTAASSTTPWPDTTRSFRACGRTRNSRS